MNNAILLTEGTRAIVAMIVNQIPLKFAKFRVGSTVGFSPRITDTDVRGYVYEGGRDSISFYVGDNKEILIVEVTMNSSVGDFNIGNIMIFDSNGKPFAYGVRDTPIPKIKTTQTQQGSEIVVQMAVRFLSNEQSSAVQVFVENESAIPVVDTETGLIAVDPSEAEFPVYIVANYNNLNVPALMYADADNDQWWVNIGFQPYQEGYFTQLSGGRVGDKYSRPAGKTYFGGYFSPLNSTGKKYSGGVFGDNSNFVSVGGGNFGD